MSLERPNNLEHKILAKPKVVLGYLNQILGELKQDQGSYQIGEYQVSYTELLEIASLIMADGFTNLSVEQKKIIQALIKMMGLPKDGAPPVIDVSAFERDRLSILTKIDNLLHSTTEPTLYAGQYAFNRDDLDAIQSAIQNHDIESLAQSGLDALQNLWLLIRKEKGS